MFQHARITPAVQQPELGTAARQQRRKRHPTVLTTTQPAAITSGQRNRHAKAESGAVEPGQQPVLVLDRCEIVVAGMHLRDVVAPAGMNANALVVETALLKWEEREWR